LQRLETEPDLGDHWLWMSNDHLDRQMAESALALATARSRAGAALTRPHNWVQLGKFCTVGVSGYVVNLAVYSILLRWAGLHYLAAAVCSFGVAVTNNYLLNRHWTFRGHRGHFAYQGLRFLVVSAVALGALASVGVVGLALLFLLLDSGTSRGQLRLALLLRLGLALRLVGVGLRLHRLVGVGLRLVALVGSGRVGQDAVLCGLWLRDHVPGQHLEG